jgi:hypothetical protein
MSIVIVRRNKKNRVKDKPTIKLYVSNNSFSLSYRATEILDVVAGDGLMFSLNYKTRKASISKDNDEDSFKLNRMPNRKILRFSSVDLVDHFLNCFGLHKEGVHIFQITPKGEKFQLEYVA